MIIFLVLLILIVTPKPAHAEISQSVYISEVSWAGSTISSADEWLELTNSTTAEIDLAGWYITRLSSSVELKMVTLSGYIPASGNYLISNYSPPNTVITLLLDLTTTEVSLANSNLQLKLYNSNGELMDYADDGIGTPAAGSTTTHSSMERKVPVTDGKLASSWITSSTPLDSTDLTKGYGTPNIAGYPTLSLSSNSIYSKRDYIPKISGSVKSPIFDYDQLKLSTDCSNPEIINIQNDLSFSQDLNNISQSDCAIMLSDPRGVSITNILKNIQLPPDGSITISEVYSHPISGEDEFIELYNNLDTKVDLTSWIVDDTANGGSAPFIITNISIEPKAYIVIYESTSKVIFNDSGDDAILIDPLGNIVSQTKFNNMEKGKAWASVSSLWQIYPHPTPMQPSPVITYPNGVIINELLPNPEGIDTDGEFIEIYNSLLDDVNLNGWILSDSTDLEEGYVLINMKISANSYLTIYYDTSKITLNNDFDHVYLYSPDGKIQSEVTYSNSTEGQSWSRFNNFEYSWTSTITPDQENILSLASNNNIINPSTEQTSPDTEIVNNSNTPSSTSNVQINSFSDEIIVVPEVTEQITTEIIPAVIIEPVNQPNIILASSNKVIITENRRDNSISNIFDNIWKLSFILIGLLSGMTQWHYLSQNNQ